MKQSFKGGVPNGDVGNEYKKVVPFVWLFPVSVAHMGLVRIEIWKWGKPHVGRVETDQFILDSFGFVVSI